MQVICPETISPLDGIPRGVRGYDSHADALRAVDQLFYRRGFNYFVIFREVNANWGLSYGWAEWVKDGIYLND